MIVIKNWKCTSILPKVSHSSVDIECNSFVEMFHVLPLLFLQANRPKTRERRYFVCKLGAIYPLLENLQLKDICEKHIVLGIIPRDRRTKNIYKYLIMQQGKESMRRCWFKPFGIYLTNQLVKWLRVWSKEGSIKNCFWIWQSFNFTYCMI